MHLFCGHGRVFREYLLPYGLDENRVLFRGFMSRGSAKIRWTAIDVRAVSCLRRGSKKSICRFVRLSVVVCYQAITECAILSARGRHSITHFCPNTLKNFVDGSYLSCPLLQNMRAKSHILSFSWQTKISLFSIHSHSQIPDGSQTHWFNGFAPRDRFCEPSTSMSYNP